MVIPCHDLPQNKPKFFEITFESLGDGTCMIIDWGDGSRLQSFGDQIGCQTNFSHAVYTPLMPLTLSMNFTHVYPLVVKNPDVMLFYQELNFTLCHVKNHPQFLMNTVTCPVDCVA